MTARSALPDRYLVDRTGSPDPGSSAYYVLDIVTDVNCRTALAQLGNLYRRQGLYVRAEEAFLALHETQDAHQRIMEARNPKKKKYRGRAKQKQTD